MHILVDFGTYDPEWHLVVHTESVKQLPLLLHVCRNNAGRLVCLYKWIITIII